MPKIRVGIIRCDTHGMYYGPLMAEHDPIRLQKPLEDPSNAVYSWQTGGAHFYFYTLYSNPAHITVPYLHEFEIARVWDENATAAESCANVFTKRPKVCNTFNEVSDDVDLVIVADCNYDGADHAELAAPGLEKGVPTFIDKPISNTFESARAIVDLAEKHNTPLLSLSILRMLPHAQRFAARFPEVGSLEFVSIRGGGPALPGQIHAICLAQNLCGPGVESVESMGENPGGFMHLNYPENPAFPRHGVSLNCDTGAYYHCSYHASAFGDLGTIHSPNLGDFEFPFGAYEIVKQIKKLVETRKPPVPYSEILENIAVASAAYKAHNTGKRVTLKEIGYEK
ncbi:MAG: Gfo/Idh/MocA family oxidoreductase [bacterium]|nr:Gfo/Idh/MocA family oxidoreductase [bacterium]